MAETSICLNHSKPRCLNLYKPTQKLHRLLVEGGVEAVVLVVASSSQVSSELVTSAVELIGHCVD